MWHHGYGYRRHQGGFFWPGLLIFGLFLLVFGRFLLPLVLLSCLIVPFVFCMKGMAYKRGWGQSWGEKPKRGDWYGEEKPKRGGWSGEEKPKRNYRQTADGEWVEIV
jgi:hypothetical protein